MLASTWVSPVECPRALGRTDMRNARGVLVLAGVCAINAAAFSGCSGGVASIGPAGSGSGAGASAGSDVSAGTSTGTGTTGGASGNSAATGTSMAAAGATSGTGGSGVGSAGQPSAGASGGGSGGVTTGNGGGSGGVSMSGDTSGSSAGSSGSVTASGSMSGSGASSGMASGASTGNSASGNATGSPSGSTSGAASGSPQCPSLGGGYRMAAVDARGCGNTLSPTSPECIRQVGCSAAISFPLVAGAKPGIRGDATLQSDGSFVGAAITEGTLPRTGCTGTWDAATSTLTVDCGGKGTTQSCVLSLTRIAATCN